MTWVYQVWMRTAPGKLGWNITRVEGHLHCATQYKENKRRRDRLESGPELRSGFLSCKQVLPSRAFHLHLCFAQLRRDLQTKVHGGLSVGPTWAGANLRYLQHPLWLPTDKQCGKEGKHSAPTLQCGLEMWPHLDKIQERKGIKIHTVALFPASSSLWQGQRLSVHFHQTSKILTNGPQISCVRINLKFGTMLGLNKTGMNKVLQHHELLICFAVSYEIESVVWTLIVVFKSCLLTWAFATGPISIFDYWLLTYSSLLSVSWPLPD